MTTTTGKSSKRKTAAASGKAAKAASATATKATRAKAGNNKPAAAEITPEQRHQLIAEAAYLRAESRGFDAGDPLDDWLQAEQEVDARLTHSARDADRAVH